MVKPNSHQSLELLGRYIHPKMEPNTLPKGFIEEFVPDIHNYVDKPQTSLRNH
jgi:hypothetical protein